MTIPAALTDSAPNAGLGRLYYLEVPIPAGTAITSPVSVSWPLEDNYLLRIDTRIPPGPSGQMGFRILWAEQQIVPWGNNSWLICDNESIPWMAETAITASGLVVEGYNTGSFSHTIYLRALISTLPPALASEVNTELGTVGLPASQVGPETQDVENYTSPASDETDETESAELEMAAPEEQEPVISPGISLVSGS
jgi:hypothetical protein